MNYLDEFKKFISSHYLSTGVRLTLGAVVPSLIFQHFGILGEMIAFPLGTLLIGSTDNPGPHTRRRNSLLIAIATCFLVACITGFLRHIHFIIFLEIVVFGMFFSLVGVYGNRVNSIGLIALLVFVFNIDDHLSGDMVLRTAAIFAAGGIWYFVLFMILQKLLPYKLIQQLLGENFVELGKLLWIKAGYYFANPDYDDLFNRMIHQQVTLRENHENLREILFKTREIVTESTNKSRILMLMFLDSIDLFERILNSQQNYANLHRAFDHTQVLRLFGTYITWLSAEIQQIGLAIQSGSPSHPKRDLDEAFNKCQRAFENMREHKMTHDNMEDFMMLRQILNSLQDVTERVKKLHRATTYDAEVGKGYKLNVEAENFIPKQEYHPRILLDNLSLKSSHFRHALRITLGLLIGYIISLFLTVGHGYWILLTIVVILKPAFSITKQRNVHRIGGTLVGVFTGFMLLYLIQDGTALFIIMMLAMIMAYSFLKINYFIASTTITLYVILSFNFLNPQQITAVLHDRVIDTIIGSIIAYLISSYVLPVWEHTQINQYIRDALDANRKYFDVVAAKFTGKDLDINELKVLRKDAIIAMANLSDNFQKMLSEPKRQQLNMEEYHQFVATSHMLTSYIASLSTYAQTLEYSEFSVEFEVMIRQIDRQIKAATDIIEGKLENTFEIARESLPQNQKLVALLAKRKKEIKEMGIEKADQSPARKMLSDLKTINGLFELISTITIDEIKILQKIKTLKT
ncbi:MULTISPECIES: FUSC family membrane protein [Dyadobacter]|uniref:FUSC family protein n=1 Tax=Dyadobacter chenhuakuii TaxID=2909339 RepID=A0A9X1QE09_9BACT|nr:MULTISPECIES: FUSC family membrane protein [Dyadobacter]MCE7071975.1 FUSC family protein [Dyadobacter sp. CY327]MCF2498079.1 FUSC family protein [Dyadobacter chenhuakuii]MCF2518920.1 FUSC family protein [Dyadobacter sp. CY351]